jgi:aminoglycoside phosphotransferase (APT) family kinase protein
MTQDPPSNIHYPSSLIQHPMDILATLGITGEVTAKPVSGGLDTLIWRVEHGQKTYALRLFRPEQLAISQREIIAMQKAFEAGIPVPKVQKTGIWQDRPAILMDWVEGRTMVAALKAQPYKLGQLAVEFGRTHAKINRIEGIGTFDHSWLNWLGDTEPDLQAYLRNLTGQSPVLLHLDYHPLNVMFDGTKVAGVLDWAGVSSGDRRADFARTVAILRLSPIENNLAFSLIRRIIEAGWRRGYEQVAGKQVGLAPFYAWAGAVMLREYTPRLSNPALNIKPEHLEKMARWRDYWKNRL